MGRSRSQWICIGGNVKSLETKEISVPRTASYATNRPFLLFFHLQKAAYFVKKAGKQDQGEKQYFSPESDNVDTYVNFTNLI